MNDSSLEPSSSPGTHEKSGLARVLEAGLCWCVLVRERGERVSIPAFAARKVVMSEGFSAEFVGSCVMIEFVGSCVMIKGGCCTGSGEAAGTMTGTVGFEGFRTAEVSLDLDAERRDAASCSVKKRRVAAIRSVSLLVGFATPGLRGFIGAMGMNIGALDQGSKLSTLGLADKLGLTPLGAGAEALLTLGLTFQRMRTEEGDPFARVVASAKNSPSMGVCALSNREQLPVASSRTIDTPREGKGVTLVTDHAEAP